MTQWKRPKWHEKEPGTQRLRFNPEKFSFVQTGEAFQRPILKARMRCAAPQVGIKVGENLMFVPPVAPIVGGNCEDIPEKHRELFFAEEGKEGDLSPDDSSAARRDFLWGHYCHDCPVREACFEYAVSYIDWGIWAGTTEAERIALRGEIQKDDGPGSLSLKAARAIKKGKERLQKGKMPLAKD